MIRILAADIGGTKTLLQLGEYTDGHYRPLCERRYCSQDHASFDEVMDRFIDEAGHAPIQRACFAIAGPISHDGAHASVTNLPWVLERDHLVRRYDLGQVTLINDFHAVAIGIDTLQADELLTLQQGQPQACGTQLVVGAGTGLGVALRIWTGSAYQVLPTEAGHAGFAPATERQRQLLDFLADGDAQVSREQLLSGAGLASIYQFISQQQDTSAGNPDAEHICRLAGQGEQNSRAALALFFEMYGSESGNLALVALPFGGVYIAGGIAAKNIDALTRSAFVPAFCDKEKMRHLLGALPVHVIRNESVGLQGARWLAGQASG